MRMRISTLKTTMMVFMRKRRMKTAALVTRQKKRGWQKGEAFQRRRRW